MYGHVSMDLQERINSACDSGVQNIFDSGISSDSPEFTTELLLEHVQSTEAFLEMTEREQRECLLYIERKTIFYV